MITCSRVTKRYGSTIALHEMECAVEKGRTVGIIGPNGSGKSTLIKSILGLVHPTSGGIILDGQDTSMNCDYRRRLGYVPQLARFPQELTGSNVIELISGLRPDPPTKKDELIELFSFGPELNKRTKAMSGGTRQKLSVILAGMYDPDILVLDEPSAGLDPIANIKLKDYLHALRHKGRTILITTHIMTDLDELADDLLLLIEGTLRYQGTVRDLKMQTQEPQLERAVAAFLRKAA